MKESVVDSIKTRMSQSSSLRSLNKKKQRCARVLLAMCIASLLIMCFTVELALRNETPGWVNGLKCAQITLLLAMYAVLVVYHRVDFRSEAMTLYTRSRFEKCYPLIEALLLLVGVLPPFVEASFAKGNLIVPDEELPPSSTETVDVLGVLMFYARLPLLFKWGVTSFVMSSPSYVRRAPAPHTARSASHSRGPRVIRAVRVPSPAAHIRATLARVNPAAHAHTRASIPLLLLSLPPSLPLGRAQIAWLYSVQVGPSFRFKFIFTQFPFRVIVLSLLIAWLAGTYCLRAFEYDADESASVHQLQASAQHSARAPPERC